MIYIKWQVVIHTRDEVMAEFDGQEGADALSEVMNNMGLRCYVRPVRDIKRELLERTRAIGG